MRSEHRDARRPVQPSFEGMRHARRFSAATFGAAGVLLMLISVGESAGATSDGGGGRVPIVFEENAGQTAAGVRFVARQGDVMTWLAPSEIVFGLGERGRERVSEERPEAEGPPGAARHRATRRTAVRMKLVGANPSPSVVGLDPLPGESHYLLGSDPAAWRTHVRHYRRVAYLDVYPGIDLIFYSREGRLEYDFEVQPGADEGVIELAFEGMEDASIDEQGDLVLRVPGGRLFHRRPSGLEGGERDHRPLETAFSGRPHGRFGFRVEGRDRRRRLRIDPELDWIRLPGASNDWSYDVAVDQAGNAYMTGITWSADFPSVGGMPGGDAESGEAFVLKLGPDNQIIYSTYFGAPGAADVGWGVAVDTEGQVAVAGETWGNIAEVSAPHPGMCAAEAGVTGFLALLAADGASFRFSTCLPADSAQAAVFDPVDPQRGVTVVGWAAGDAFIGRYLPIGAFVYARTWGGSSTDRAYDVALDPAGHAFVAGRADSADLPGTSGGLQTTLPFGGGFVAAFSPTGVLEGATYLGGSTGRSLAHGVALDPSGDVYVTGRTVAADFPLAAASRAALRDSPWGPVPTAFLTKLRPNLSELVYSTFYAQENVPVDGVVEYVDSEEGRKVVVDSAGNVHVIGAAFTFNDATYFAGVFGWLASFDPAGQPKDNLLLDLTANGDEAFGIAVADGGEVYIVGHVDYLWACESVEGGGQRCYDVSDSDVFIGRVSGPPAAEIVILPSTTRWKPQRDTAADVKVVFKGPTDLDPSTVGLEVTLPEGFFGSYTPTRGDVQKVAGEEDEYTFQWIGPWTYTDGTRLPTGDYAIVVEGTFGSGTPIQSEPHTVSLVEITGIALSTPAGAQLALNTGPGGGEAVFPESEAPGGNIHDTVVVTATVEPAVPDPGMQGPVRAYFQAIDVDDPSATNNAVDAEDSDTDNRADELAGLFAGVVGPRKPTDPIPAPAAAVGQPLEIAVGTDGKAITTLRVSPRQGDNYRVAVSFDQTWLANTHATQRTTEANAGEVLHSGGENPVLGTDITPVLTVWRTLHLEIDHLDSSMVAQEFFDLTGTSTKLEPTRLEDKAHESRRPFQPRKPRGERYCDHCDENDWRGADLWPRDPFAGQEVGPERPDPLFEVTGNKKHFVTVDAGDDLTKAPAEVGDPYRLRDDYWVDLDRGLPLELTRQLLERAYVEVTGVGDRDQHRFVPFRDETRNLSFNDLARFGDPSQPPATRQRDVPSSESFWSVIGIVAFDPFVLQSCDPCGKRQVDPRRKSLGTMGQTMGGTPEYLKTPQDPRQPVFAVYLETIRDRREGQLTDVPPCSSSFENLLEVATAHEIVAHALGLGSTSTTLTDEDRTAAMACSADPAARQLVDDQFKVLRQVREPFLNAGDAVQQ